MCSVYLSVVFNTRYEVASGMGEIRDWFRSACNLLAYALEACSSRDFYRKFRV
jgi:hypothetical protein